MVRRKKKSGGWLLKTAILLGIFVGVWLFSSIGCLPDSQRKSQFDNLGSSSVCEKAIAGTPVQSSQNPA